MLLLGLQCRVFTGYSISVEWKWLCDGCCGQGLSTAHQGCSPSLAHELLLPSLQPVQVLGAARGCWCVPGSSLPKSDREVCWFRRNTLKVRKPKGKKTQSRNQEWKPTLLVLFWIPKCKSLQDTLRDGVVIVPAWLEAGMFFIAIGV